MRQLLSRSLMMGLILVLCGVARAGALNADLVVDPSFEHVNTGVTLPYGQVLLLDWQDFDGGGDDNYAYRYSSGYSGSNVPAGAGIYFFSGGLLCGYGDVLACQVIDVSAGPTGIVIAGDTATYSFSAWFSGYADQEYSAMRAVFLDGSDTPLGASPLIGGDAFCRAQPRTDGRDRNWAQDLITGAVPGGTATVRIEIVADSPGSTVYHDGYVDLVDFRIIPEPATLSLLAVGLVTLAARRGELHRIYSRKRSRLVSITSH